MNTDPYPARPVQHGHDDGRREHGSLTAESAGEPGTATEPDLRAYPDPITAKTKKDPPEGYQAL
jgi:hypothetical protein